MTQTSSLIIRADASREIGTGHVMRCLALAQFWNTESRQAVFAVGRIPEGLEKRLSSEGISISQIASSPGTEEDAAELIAAARRTGTNSVVLDGYHFGAGYQEAIKESGLKVLFIDDYGHAESYFADLVLNQNFYAEESMYRRRSPETKLLLGTRYALLRREFLSWSAWSRSVPTQARHLLVTLGGSDPSNTTAKVVRSLCDVQMPDLEVKILLGLANRHHEDVRQATEQVPERFEILNSQSDIAGLMAWADLAITAAGSTCWELAFMGLPSVTVELAENQQRIAKSLADAGIAFNAGWHSDLDTGRLKDSITHFLGSPGERAEMSRRGRMIVDGCGARRVTEILLGAETEVC